MDFKGSSVVRSTHSHDNGVQGQSPWPSFPSPVVAITGASSGLGRATVRHFAACGWRVGLIARGAAVLAAAAAECRTLTAIECVDVTDAAALAAAARRIEAALGPIAVWINCAGTGVFAPFERVSDAEFRRVVDVTFLGTVNGTRAALALMRPRGAGRILNVCSGTAYRGIGLLSSYVAAKAAVRGFTQSVRAELRCERCPVSIGSAFPPAINTPFFQHAANHMGRPPRPAPPVYQPDVIARGLYLAALSRRGEIPLGGITVLFEWATRLVPWLTDAAIARLGYDGQLVDTRAATAPTELTLFEPGQRDFGAEGSFTAESRRFSLHLAWLSRSRLWRRSAAPSRPAPAAAAPDPAPAGSP